MKHSLYLLLHPVLIVKLHVKCLPACFDYLVIVSELPVVGVYVGAAVPDTSLVVCLIYDA